MQAVVLPPKTCLSVNFPWQPYTTSQVKPPRARARPCVGAFPSLEMKWTRVHAKSATSGLSGFGVGIWLAFLHQSHPELLDSLDAAKMISFLCFVVCASQFASVFVAQTQAVAHQNVCLAECVAHWSLGKLHARIAILSYRVLSPSFRVAPKWAVN